MEPMSVCRFSSQLSIISDKEHGNGIRSYMGAGAIVIGGVDKLSYLYTLLNLFHDIEGILIGICVSDSYDLLLRLYDIFTYQIDEGVQ
jgi:hypothetical protein